MEHMIKLRWMAVDDLVGQSMVQEALKPGSLDDLKAKAIAKLGITRHDDETFGQAWLRAMSEENGLAYAVPVDRRLADVLRENISAYRFYFWLI